MIAKLAILYSAFKTISNQWFHPYPPPRPVVRFAYHRWKICNPP